MKFYILDDLIASVRVLENIIEAKDLGEIVGTGRDPERAIPEILAKSPDIVLIDLLMPKKDGISVVKEIREFNRDISFIMVSQVVEKQMIQEAYEAGIEFFITKPNNRIEIEKVLQNVIEKRRMARMLKGIRSVMGDGAAVRTASASAEEEAIARARRILGAIGMLGESGTKDILAVLRTLLHEDAHYNGKSTLDAYAGELGADSKIVRQRIRRAIRRGLSNVAALGVEDYSHEIFSEYAHTLFNFDAVRSEMDVLRGKSQYGGSPSIDKFFEGLELLCRDA